MDKSTREIYELEIPNGLESVMNSLEARNDGQK